MDERLKNLVQSYLDDELSAEEAQELIGAMKGDRAAVRGLKALERVVELAESLPPPALPADFVARTLARLDRVPEPKRSLLSRLAAFKLELGLPQLLAAGLVTAAVAFLPWLVHSHSAGQASQAQEATVAVQFTLRAPEAKQVQLAGDFNGWNPASSPLRRQADGTYRLELRLPRGRYQYAFVVDGQRWVPDPLAAEVVEDGFGGRNAVISL